MNLYLSLRNLMKQLWLLVTILISLLVLTSCSEHTTYYETHVNHQLLAPNWMRYVQTNPVSWTKGAGPWFFKGEPTSVERNVRFAPYSDTIGISAIRVPDFTALTVEGSFEVQILGNQDRNSVYILGPHSETRQIEVTVNNKSLILKQDPTSKTKLTHVIIRVGIHELRELNYSGCSKITGRDVTSRNLVINFHGSETVLLDGRMTVTKINHDGSGTLTILGVVTPNLDLCVKGNGNANLAGRIGISHLKHIGNGAVRIIGADTNKLCIEAGGKGFTTLAGYMNLQSLTARDFSSVYLYWVNSRNATIIASEHAQVGLAGNVNTLNLDLTDDALFDGQSLCTVNLYSKTNKSAHANARAVQSAFISAANNSSVYFFGASDIVSIDKSGSAIVLVLNDGKMCRPIGYAYQRGNICGAKGRGKICYKN